MRADNTSGWVRLPGRTGGTVAGLATALADDATTLVFAATSAGVYRSTDRGQTWTATSLSRESIPFCEVIAASPGFARDRTLFAGGRNGLYRSRDAGTTWTHVLAEGHVMTLALTPEILFAGTEQDGILRSEDAGRTWTSANPGLLDLTVLALAVSPTFDVDATGLAATASGLYRTRNSGKSWREVDLGMEAAVQCLALSPAFAEDRLALAGTESDGLLRSADAGARWESVSGLAGRSVTALAFASNYPTSATIAAATDQGLAVSIDGGESWRFTAAELGSILTLGFVPGADGEVLLAGLHRDGVARVATDARRWTLANAGLEARLLLALALSPTFDEDHTLFTAGPDDGVLVSSDAGQTWTAHLVGPEDPSVFGVVPSADYERDQTLFAATALGVQRSRDRGQTWQVLPTESEPSAVRAVGGAVLDASGKAHILAAHAGGRLLASDDGGESWRLLGDGFGGADIVSVAVSPEFARDQTLCVGTADARVGEVVVWRSVDGGKTWQRWLVERGGEPLAVVVPRQHASGGLVFVGLGGQVLKPLRQTSETRRGERRPMWRGVQVGAPGTLVTALATPPDASNGRTLFAGTSTGVFVSRDGGDHFRAWESEGGPGAVVGVVVSPSYARDRLVFALGLGGAIWRRRDDP